MATATKKTVAKPAARAAVSANRPAATGGNKAAAAAQQQGRQAPARAPAQSQQRNVPAVQPKGKPPIDPATLSSLPAFMQNDADIGKEQIRPEDLEVPRLKLMQGTSKELQEYNELRPGHFFHTAAEQIFDGPFRAVPIFMTRTYLLWRPLESGGGILARADDGDHWSPGEGSFDVTLDRKDGGHKVTWTLAPTVRESGLANWGTMNPDDPNSPPAATLMYNYLLAFPDHPDLMPAVYTFQRSGIKAGRNLATKLRTIRAPLFGIVLNFTPVTQTNKANQDFFNVSVASAGLVEDMEEYAKYRSLHEQFSTHGLNIRNIDELQKDADEIDGAQPGEDANAPKY